MSSQLMCFISLLNCKKEIIKTETKFADREIRLTKVYGKKSLNRDLIILFKKSLKIAGY